MNLDDLRPGLVLFSLYHPNQMFEIIKLNDDNVFVKYISNTGLDMYLNRTGNMEYRYIKENCWLSPKDQFEIDLKKLLNE